MHYLDIRLNDAHIPDSPFAVMVGSSASDPAMVIASGEGLEKGKCGNNYIILQADDRFGPKVCQIGPKIGQIRDFFRSDSVHFGAPSQNVLNLI